MPPPTCHGSNHHTFTYLQKVRDCDGVQKALLVVLQTIGTLSHLDFSMYGTSTHPHPEVRVCLPVYHVRHWLVQ